MTIPVIDPAALAPLLYGWEEGMLYAYLSGRMGYAVADKEYRSAQVRVGDFCFLAGEPDAAVAAWQPALPQSYTIFIPRTRDWDSLIAQRYPQARRSVRYAFRKDNAFDAAALHGFAAMLPEGYLLKRMGKALYRQAEQAEWSRDLVSQYPTWEAYAVHGAGYAVLWKGALVCGASSYADWPGGVEIEIDTHPAHRRRGLARACAAALMLDCLARGLYPSWDAANPVSAHLAQTLGYIAAGAYPVYELSVQ